MPDPNPLNYTIVRYEYVVGYLVVEIKYTDCINFEGRKILVYECTIEDLIIQKEIDPHFCDNENIISPIARFKPTEKGWNHACIFAKNI